MLHSLYIKNLAIIKELSINFENGLNIITGETGAGKSLIIKAIQLLLGKKFTKELLKEQDKKLYENLSTIIQNNSNLDSVERELKKEMMTIVEQL